MGEPQMAPRRRCDFLDSRFLISLKPFYPISVHCLDLGNENVSLCSVVDAMGLSRFKWILDALPHDPAAGQVRRPGAGRKKKSCPTRPLNRT